MMSTRHYDPARPLVSCLCVTRGKPERLRRAIQCFESQTYDNRELVLICEDDDLPTCRIGSGIAELNPRVIVHTVPAKPKKTLGELRNLSLSRSSGSYLCQWDDDDWYHCQRIEIQLATLESSRKFACLLTNWIVFNEEDFSAYFAPFRLWEGSVLFHRSVLETVDPYRSLSRREDTEFTQRLVQRGHVFPLVHGGLYIYTAHGSNTWGSQHFRTLLRMSTRFSDEASLLVRHILEGRYSVQEASRLLRSDALLSEYAYFGSKAR